MSTPAKGVVFEFAMSAPGAGAPILASDVQPGSEVAEWRIMVVLGGTSKFNIIAKKGATTKTWSFLAGPLIASVPYTFTIEVNPKLTYNFSVTASVAIDQLSVTEVLGSVS